jgi:hypothetical protein
MGHRLANIEYYLEFFVGVRVNNGHTQGCKGEGPRVGRANVAHLAVFGELFQDFVVRDGARQA